MATKTAKKEKEPKTTEENVDQIDAILGEKAYKEMHLGSRSGDEIEKPDIITTGSLFFDLVLGGGYRSSSWSRAFSPPEHGKTAQGLRWAKNWQDKYAERAMVVCFNAEGRVTADLIQRSGLDTSRDRFRLIDSNKSDFIYTMIERLVSDNENDKVYFFMVDSTDACERLVDIAKSIGEAEKIGGSATILSAAGKRLSLIFSVTGHTLYMSSQIRDKMSAGPGGPGTGGKAPSGGNAPQFYSSLTMEIKKHWTDFKILENTSDKTSKEVGRLVQIKLEKTPNERTGEIVLVPVKYGKIGGIWTEYEAMMICQAWNHLDTKTSWYTFKDSYLAELKAANVTLETVKFNGERALRECFETNPDLVDYVHSSTRKLNGI